MIRAASDGNSTNSLAKTFGGSTKDHKGTFPPVAKSPQYQDWNSLLPQPENNFELIILLLPTDVDVAMAESQSFLHLARPLGPASVGAAPTTAPLTVIIQPQTVLSIVDHALRRHVSQERVIGTLLGSRSEDGTEVEIRNCFAVGHNESQEQVEVDMEYQKAMLALYLKANPKEVLVGWYATNPNLDAFSALIQNFYGSQGDGTFPHQAVHLTVSTTPGKDIEARTYISAPVGVTTERAVDSCLFIPVPHELKYGDTEKSGLELLATAKARDDRKGPVITDIQSLEGSILDLLEMLESVSEYVSSVLDEETRPSRALGQYLINALALAPKLDQAEIEKNL
ncbi:MAG: hypothetical protein M1814_004675 [Vezdaea aestivalis]|nr:MAG: hypothetical protein M1814_004675 [Vezdaea aestivalis]